MKRFIRLCLPSIFLCLISTAGFAQLPGMQLPRPQLPDDTTPSSKPVHHQKISTKQVEEKLRKGFDNKNAAYTGSNIQPAVDDQSITLTGTVSGEGQREMALQLARAYADDRRVIDRLAFR